MQANITNRDTTLLAKFFPLIIFCSSFLSFSVQPLFSKLLLPKFGGSAMVWTTSSLFFQIVLLMSYGYIFILERLSGKNQILVHLVVAIVVIILSYTTFFGETLSLAQLPTLVSLSSQGGEWQQIVSIGILTVGLSFFFLGTVSTFLQVLASRLGIMNPYSFYKASNFGSFAGLFAYPFILEPTITTQTFIQVWIIAFLLVIGSIIVAMVTNVTNIIQDKSHFNDVQKPNLNQITSWILLSAFPVALSLAVTNQITLGVAPVPYLWIFPFGVYLLSYTLAFGSIRLNGLLPIVGCVLSLNVFFLIIKGSGNIIEYFLQNFLLVAITFIFSLIFHTLAYNKRPAKEALSYFYLCLAFGGMIGGILVSIISPVIFKNYFELEILLATGILVSIYLYSQFQPISVLIATKNITFSARRLSTFTILCFTLFTAMKLIHPIQTTILYQSRNFYGTLEVTENNTQRFLFNGTILHGSQNQHQNTLSANNYYSPKSGIGKTLTYFRNKRQHNSLKIGVIGLGVGNLASYCLENDQFVFYEINQQVIDVAKTYFTYLDHCSGSEIRKGDARAVISLEEPSSAEDKYDVLIVDAFTDDAIPTHLLTSEAGQLFMDRIKDDGALIYHISNRYLALNSVLAGFSETNNVFGATLLRTPPISPNSDEIETEWFIISRSKEDVSTIAEDFLGSGKIDQPVLWTDEYSNILKIIKF